MAFRGDSCHPWQVSLQQQSFHTQSVPGKKRYITVSYSRGSHSAAGRISGHWRSGPCLADVGVRRLPWPEEEGARREEGANLQGKAQCSSKWDSGVKCRFQALLQTHCQPRRVGPGHLQFTPHTCGVFMHTKCGKPREAGQQCLLYKRKPLSPSEGGQLLSEVSPHSPEMSSV